MNENWLVLGSAVLVIVVYCISESIRTASLINSIERPLWKHFKDWDNNVPQFKKRSRNKDYQRDFYAYSRLVPDELKEIRMILKCRQSEGSFTQTLLDLLWKLSLPVLTVLIGLTVVPAEPSLFVKLHDWYPLYLGHWLKWTGSGTIVFACIVLLQHLFSGRREKILTYHTLHIDQALTEIYK